MTKEIRNHPSWIEINLNQFKKNISIIKNYLGKTLFCLPIKANAYGHGLRAIGKASEDAGVDYLAVAHLQEAIKLRESNVNIPILVLGAIHEDQISDLIFYNLEFTLSSKFKADLVSKHCNKIKKNAIVHLEIDSGMQRTGVRPDTFPSFFDYVNRLEYLNVRGVYSHLVNSEIFADQTTTEQIDCFKSLTEECLNGHLGVLRHIANSGSIQNFPNSFFDMARPSLITFGYSRNKELKALSEIAPCFSLKSKISYFKVVNKNQGISYGHSYVTDKQTRIVTVPVGYGDGYRRCLSNKGFVLIRGKRFPVVGTICMDQLMVDIGDEEAYVGDEVVLIGKQDNEEIPVEEIATLCNTNIHEVLCFFNGRLPRVYT